MKTYVAEDLSTTNLSYIRPKSILARDEISHQPVHVKGIILKIYCSHGAILWFELLAKTKLSKGDSLFIYTSNSLSNPTNKMSDPSTITVGDTMMFYSVYPVYLWGRLHGFAMTKTSSFEIYLVNSRLSPSLLSRSHSCEIQSAHRELMISRQTTQFLSLKCSVFIAWCAYVNRRVKQCISSSSTYRYESHDHGRLFSNLLSTCRDPTIYDVPVHINQDELCVRVEDDPFYTIRSGQDLDYLCLMIPEIWSCGMVRQFVINSRHQRMMKEGSTPSEDRFNECLIWMERIQSSKSRHETHSCDHSVCVLASVIDVCVTKQLWLIALCDSVGEKIIAIISPKNGTMLSILKSSVRSPIVLLIQNPAIVIQSFPCHAEESLKCFLVASEDSIHLIDDCSSTFNLNPSSETISIDSEILIQSFHDSKEMTSFLSSHLLQNKCFPCKDARSNISLDIGVSNGGLSVLNVRDVLLHEIYPKQVKVLSCVAGIITRIQFIPSSQSNVSSSTKKMKVEYIDKYLIDLRDLTYSDTITMYLPASFLTSELCILGMVVYIFNSKLKCSSNCKNIYLEFKLSDSSIVFSNFIPPESSKLMKMKSSPCSQLCDLMSNSYRNRCLWNVRVTITFIREIEVYRMCTFCLKPMVSGHSHTSRMPVQCQNCHHVNSVKKISWKCVCLVDDGTGEAYMCFDGQYALKLIQCSLVNSSNLCTCSDGESKNISFHEIQQLIEKIVCKYFLHLKSQDVYSLLSTSFEMNSSFSRHLSNDIPMCICQRYESFSSLLSSSLHNFSSDLLLQLLYLLHDVIRLCYSSTSYEILIKLIHSKTSTLKKMQDEEKMNSSHQRCEKTIVIQKLNDPYWSIDNIDICSESFEQLRLQCYDLKVLKNAELSTIAWQILQEIN